MLRLRRVASWTSAAGRGASKFGLLAVTAPDELVAWYIKRLYMDLGSSSGIYVVRLQPGGRGQEVQRFQLMNDLEESGAFGFVRVAVLGEEPRYFTVGSSGIVNSLGCRYSGASLRLEDGHVVCLCDGYDNCNGTSNSRYTLYDPLTDVIIHGGDCTGFNLWLLSGDHGEVLARLTVGGYERPFASHLAVIPTDGDDLVVLAGNSAPAKGVIVGAVDIDDLVENGPRSARLDELPSWRVLLEEPEWSVSCITCAKSLGSELAVAVDRGGETRTLVFDPSRGSYREVPGIAFPIPLGGLAYFDGAELVVEAGGRELLREAVGGRGRLASAAGNLVASLNTLTGQVDLYALAAGDEPLVPAVDLDSGEVGFVDVATGERARGRAYVLWTRLSYSYYQNECTQTLPLLRGRPEAVELAWGRAPEPASDRRPSMSILPALVE